MKRWPLLLALSILMLSCNSQIPFSETQWREDPYSRYHMADNIINSRMLIGKDTSDVRELLGPELYLRNDEKDHWSYRIGGKEFTLLYEEQNYLFVDFENGKCVAVARSLD